MLIFSYKKNFLIKVSCIHFLLKNLKLTFEETRIYSLECLNSYDLNEEENNFEGERKTKARRLCHLTKETYPLSLLLSSSVWKREERVHAFCPCFSVDARSSWTLFPSDTTNTQQRFGFLSHRVRTRGPFNMTSCYPIVREISHQLISAKIDPRVSIHPLGRGWIPRYTRNIRNRHNEQIYSSVELTSSSLFQGKVSKTIDSKIDSIRAENKEKRKVYSIILSVVQQIYYPSLNFIILG